MKSTTSSVPAARSVTIAGLRAGPRIREGHDDRGAGQVQQGHGPGHLAGAGGPDEQVPGARWAGARQVAPPLAVAVARPGRISVGGRSPRSVVASPRPVVASPGPSASPSRRAGDAVAQATATATRDDDEPDDEQDDLVCGHALPHDPLGRARMWCRRAVHHKYSLHTGRMVLPGLAPDDRVAAASVDGRQRRPGKEP